MKSDQQSTPLTAYQTQLAYEDEISLVDIFRVLLRRKKLILGIFVFVTCIGLIYAFAAKRIYEVETILLPPSFEDVQPLNVLNNTTAIPNKVSSSNVFSKFLENANSRKLRKEFFDEFELLEMLSEEADPILTTKNINDNFEGFSKALIVKLDKKTNSARITLKGIHKDKIGLWLDNFIDLANQKTVYQLINNLDSIINSQIKNIKINISSKRSIYKKRREDELGRLQEAYQIAKNLGIRDYNIGDMSSKNTSLSIYMQDKKTYMQGTKMLQAEIDALKNRKSDDIHIVGLRDLQERLTQLEAIEIDKNKLQTVFIDKKAVVSVEPIRPKRMLILILSIILGGMLGIITAFIMEFIGKLKLNQLLKEEE